MPAKKLKKNVSKAVGVYSSFIPLMGFMHGVKAVEKAGSSHKKRRKR